MYVIMDRNVRRNGHHCTIADSARGLSAWDERIGYLFLFRNVRSTHSSAYSTIGTDGILRDLFIKLFNVQVC